MAKDRPETVSEGLENALKSMLIEAIGGTCGALPISLSSSFLHPENISVDTKSNVAMLNKDFFIVFINYSLVKLLGIIDLLVFNNVIQN